MERGGGSTYAGYFKLLSQEEDSPRSSTALTDFCGEIYAKSINAVKLVPRAPRAAGVGAAGRVEVAELSARPTHPP